LANGGAKFTREIAGQNTLLSRTQHGFAYDSVRDEIVMPQKLASAVLTFRGDANGDVAPIRKIMGPKTLLENDSILTVDGVHGEIFVPQPNAILVFDTASNGDVPPIRVIKGPDTMLEGNGNVQVDPVNNFLIVSGYMRGGGGGDGDPRQVGRSVQNRDGENGGGGRMLIFERTANGNVKPLRVITGPTVGSALATYGPKGWILATMRKIGHDAPESYVGVWHVNDSGNVPPRWTIGGPNPKGALSLPHGIAVDAKNKSVIVSDNDLNAVLTFEVPELFD
jgi:hypothetical protein